MPQVPMFDAISGSPASAAHNNAIIDNVQDHETRMVTVENRTTNTSGNVGIGNQRLSDRMGAGITTAAPADTRLATVESTTTNGTTGNAALGTRVTALEASSGNTPVYGRATDNAGQTIGSTASTFTGITFNTNVQSTGVTYSSGTNTFTVGAGNGGLFIISGGATFTANATNGRGMQLWVNGSPIAGGGYQYTPGSASTHAVVFKTKIHRLAAGDTVRLALWQSSGGNITLQTATDLMAFLEICRIAP